MLEGLNVSAPLGHPPPAANCRYDQTFPCPETLMVPAALMVPTALELLRSRDLHVLLVQLHDAGLFAYAIPHARIPLLILDSCASPVWPSELYELVQAWACDSFWAQEHQPWGFCGNL